MSIRIQCPLVYQLYMLLVFVLAMVLANDYQIGYYRPYSAYSNGGNNGGQRRGNAGGGGSRIITGFQCPYPNGRFAHPFKCDRYIQCNDDGMPELRFCLDGKWFDDFVKCCRPKAEAHCLSRPKPKARIGPIQPPPPEDPYYFDPVPPPPPPPPPPPYYTTTTNGTSTTSTTTSTTPPSTTTRNTTTTETSANLADYDGEF